MKSFIVDASSDLFRWLSYATIFHWIKRFAPAVKEPGSVELWVLGNFAASVALLALPDAPSCTWWEMAVVAYASLRTYELVVYQTNVLFFDELRKGPGYELRGYRRLLLLLTLNYIELIFWFALIYRHLSESFAPSVNAYGAALAVSFSTMSGGFREAASTPVSEVAKCVVQTQSAIGFFMALLVLARFISLLPNPKSGDPRERNE